MSMWSVFIILACLFSYRLGSFNATHPGVAWRCCQETAHWLWASLKK